MKPYKRRNFLINRRFQVRLAFYVCSWLIGVSFVYPLVIHNIFEYFIRYAALDPMGPDLVTINNTRIDILTLLIASQILFLFLTFLISLFLAHRIAGPLYKLGHFLETAAKTGDITRDLTFRKHDHFQELAAQYNQMMHELRQRIAGASTRIESAVAHADPEGKRQLEEALRLLPISVPPKEAP